MNKDFLILYGSETSQGESIADQIYAKCIDMKLDPRLCKMNEVDKEFYIEKEKLAVIVVSSTGDGDPPENAHRFFRKISKKTLDSDYLSNLEFALLGLGDSNYSTYQGAPKKLEKFLIGLGSTKILDTGAADDQVGLELEVEPWLEKLYAFLAKRFGCSSLDPLVSDCLKEKKSEESAPFSDSTVAPGVEKIAISVADRVAGLNMGEEDVIEDKKLPFLGIEPIAFPSDVPCLIKGAESISNDANLRVPVAPQAFIASAVNQEKLDISQIKWQNGDRFPGQHSEPVTARVVGTSEVSLQGQVRKPKLQIDVMITENSDEATRFMDNCDAGDSVYFIFSNPKNEVDFILEKLSLTPIADNNLNVTISSKTEKRDPKVPGYIPNPCTLRYLLTYCLDFRRAPGRPLLRVFAEHAGDEKEKRRLLELCSAQGVQEFTSFVRQAAVSIVDLMIAFPSALPPIDRLIELLPRLIPRPYSVSNHRSRHGCRIRFVYSLLNFEAVNGVQFDRFGVCSTYLKQLQIGDTVKLILKESSKFRLPPIAAPTLDITKVPLILIGPGTGIAPFASFFQKLLAEKLTGKSTDGVKRYLFYGSADLSKEFIFQDELEALNREGIITDLVLCESRPDSGDGRPKYVQDALRARGKEITELVFNETSPKALIFACGDAKGMSKDLFNCFSGIFQEHLGKTATEALALLKQLKDGERYIEDVWSGMRSSRVLKKAVKKLVKMGDPVTKEAQPAKIWPNVFVAFRVQNEEVRTPIEAVQQKLLAFSSLFGSKLVPSRALHITLMVARIEEEQIESAIKAMSSIGKEIREKETKIHVHFHGIGSFGSRVLFGGVKEDSVSTIREVQKLVTTQFDNHGIIQLDKRPEFNPHLTIARGPRRDYEKHLEEGLIACVQEDYVLGIEKVEEILLCRMSMDKHKDDFYQILHSERV